VPITKTFTFGEHQVTLETGTVARQASGAVIVRMGDTVILATVVFAKNMKEGIDFLPLTVMYQERSYAAGKIPGGYFKREGRPTEVETLTSRLIDRPIRPLFAEGFYHEVQLVVSVLSLDTNVNPDIPSLLGASAALSIAGVPFNGPIGAARVGYKEGVYLLNPSMAQVLESELDLVVAGTEKAVLMVESEAKELSEEIMSGAVHFGHQQMQVAIKAIKEFAAEVGNPPMTWQPPVTHDALEKALNDQAQKELEQAYSSIPAKTERLGKINELRKNVIEKLTKDEKFTEHMVRAHFESLEAKIVRHRILDGKPRIDGRDTAYTRFSIVYTRRNTSVSGWYIRNRS
jgi:polyribonucleotide nucleotidyltransferase